MRKLKHRKLSDYQVIQLDNTDYLFTYLFKYILLIMLLHLCHYSPPPCTPSPTHIPTFSSCPCVISSLASTFPILFLPSPCLFSTYHLCYLFSIPLTRTGTEPQKWRSHGGLATGEWEEERGGKGTENKYYYLNLGN
ncbi:hypothetical protein HJG60_010180 [Phyllostomus discolor]|uniref:Uncharacterized protein n=1 Tax=Phyllostomus discolor TaxID=89673 RepID=A0A834AW72_9CHIR|nr:hypothetical protein HJG60_010180 [Phyllostomus discolor]